MNGLYVGSIDNSKHFSVENITDLDKIDEKCGKIMAEYIQLEGQAEEEKNKLKTRANRKTGLGELD